MRTFTNKRQYLDRKRNIEMQIARHVLRYLHVVQKCDIVEANKIHKDLVNRMYALQEVLFANYPID